MGAQLWALLDDTVLTSCFSFDAQLKQIEDQARFHRHGYFHICLTYELASKSHIVSPRVLKQSGATCSLSLYLDG